MSSLYYNSHHNKYTTLFTNSYNMQYSILVASAILAAMQMTAARHLGSNSPGSACGPTIDNSVCVIFEDTDDECCTEDNVY